MDAVYIDGLEIKKTWGMVPLYDEFYSTLMQFPDIKERISSDYEDEDGVNVNYSAGKLKSKESQVSFGVDTYQHYIDFCNYMLAHPLFVLSSFVIDSGISLEYISHSKFSYYATGCTFGVKLREANYKKRSNIYLITENNDYICTEDGNKIIL